MILSVDIERRGRIKMLNIYPSTEIFVTFSTEKTPNGYIIIVAKEVMFLVALVSLSVCLSACLFVCLSVDNITQKVMNGLG